MCSSTGCKIRACCQLWALKCYPNTGAAVGPAVNCEHSNATQTHRALTLCASLRPAHTRTHAFCCVRVCTLAGTLGDATLSQHAAHKCNTWPDSLVSEHPAVKQICSRQLGSQCYTMTLPCPLSLTSGCSTEDGTSRLHCNNAGN